MKRCIVNVWSTGREDYKLGSERMVLSAIDKQFNGDFLLFSPEYKLKYQRSISSINNSNFYTFKSWGFSEKYGEALPHRQASHQFKSYVIQYAREQGYEQIMWCDCTTLFLKPFQKYFDLAEEIGIVTFDADKAIEAEYTADITLEGMGCSIEYARSISQVASGVMIFDFRREITNKIFDEFIKYCSIPEIINGEGGSNRPEFKDTRHDQAIISYLIRKHGCYPLSFGGFMWGGDLEKVKKYSPTFLNYGIGKDINLLKGI
jgi:hypothetical protein